MACSRVVYLFTFVVIMISTGKGRWLATTDRVNDINTTNVLFHRMSVSDLGSGERCKSTYGFLPCANTVLESLFLMVMYTHVLMLAEEWSDKGSAALLIHFRDRKVVGSVFRVLKALPRIVMIIVPGALCTQSDARKQVDFGVAMYAGTTVITLTGMWGVNVVLNKEKLRGIRSSNENKEELCGTTSSDKILLFLQDFGVSIQNDTRIMVLVMILSLIPFAIVLLLQVFIGHVMILFALIVSTLSFSSYVAYQIVDPWMQDRSVAYLKQDHFQQIFLEKLQVFIDINLYDIQGQPNMKAIESIFNLADTDRNGLLTREELKRFIREKIIVGEEKISKVYALKEIIRHFDIDDTKGISKVEFSEGCKRWLDKWKGSKNDLSTLEAIYKKLLVDNKIKDLLVLPKTLLHPLINKTVNEKGEDNEKHLEE